MDLTKRIQTIENIIYKFIKDRRELNYSPELVKNAIQEYYDNLSKWKNVFMIPNNLDRHKVASLTGHYILKHSPIEYNHKFSKPAGEFANETVVIHIALSHLKHGNNININKEQHGSLLKILREHRELLGDTNYDWKNVELMVRHFSLELAQIEMLYILQSNYPSV